MKTILYVDKVFDDKGVVKYIVEEKIIEYKELQKKLKKLQQTDIDLKENSKVYFSKGCRVPRSKFKTYGEPLKISSTRTPNKADYIVITDNTYNELFSERIWGRSFSNKSFYEQSIDSLKNSLSLYDYDRLTDSSISMKDVIFSNDVSYGILRSVVNTSSYNDCHYESHMCLDKSVTKEDLESMYNSTSFVNEKSILTKLNSESELDEDTYNVLRSMFLSSDVSNHTVAMEIMANNDFKKSIVYNGLLFYEFGDKMWSNKHYNHINFKSLRVFHEIDTYPNFKNLDNIVNLMKKYKLFTEKNNEKLLPLYQTRIMDIVNGFSRYANIRKDSIFIDAAIDLDPEEVPQVEENTLQS